MICSECFVPLCQWMKAVVTLGPQTFCTNKLQKTDKVNLMLDTSYHTSFSLLSTVLKSPATSSCYFLSQFLKQYFIADTKCSYLESLQSHLLILYFVCSLLFLMLLTNSLDSLALDLTSFAETENLC